MTELALEWISAGETQTRSFGRELGRALRGPARIALVGGLGAGKTRLAQGICEGLGYAGRVRSPTFVLENRYPGRLPIRHQDLYRLEVPDDDMMADWEEDTESVFLIEWADRACEETLAEPDAVAAIGVPTPRLRVSIEMSAPTHRILRLRWYARPPLLGNWSWEPLTRRPPRE